PRLLALELELALAVIGLDAVERGEEIGLPRGAAILAVGDRLEARRLLLADQRDDLAVFDGLQRGRVDLAALAFLTRLMQRRRARQAADVVGAKGRRGALHGENSQSTSWPGLSRPSMSCRKKGVDARR